MRTSHILRIAVAACAAAAVLTGCEKFPGQPDEHHHKYVRPEDVSDFKKLFSDNCAACHSIETGKVAAARPLNDPEFLKFIGKANIVKVITDGVKGTAMPPLSEKNGSFLTEAQITILADGILKNAGIDPAAAEAPGTVGTAFPAYAAPLGNPEAGKAAFAANCASCHGADGQGSAEKKIGSITDPNFLGLVSDQSIRSLIVAGRFDLKHPDRTQVVAGKTLSDTEIADITGYLASLRPNPETGVVNPAPVAATVQSPSPTPGS